ncbi:MAG: TRC40/GET3/ArsA family transport-energizing ATPase [Peptoniphilaceae bacterium]|nr:TRC40/GET3/ArsA family transport-energizing ATPase [Peptoniphilaceae bacterium]MDY6019178.1 TRC40/GET3/ArsA family transport-energizing ATPase [Anaerococcus sp.]
MRIILYTGKGGVGKTSISAASGLKASKDKKTIILSTDMAHSLSDSFDVKSKNNQIKINENLTLEELNPILSSKKAWGHLHAYLRELIEKKANANIDFDEMLLLPGFDDLFSLLRILEIYKENKHELLIVDCAPTGETLSLLSYGEKIEVFAKTIVPLFQNFNKAFGNFISKKTSVPKPKDIVFEEFKALADKLTKLDYILHDNSITSLRIVTTLEDIVLDEAKRNYAYLKLYNYNVDAVFINKIYPQDFFRSGFNDLKEKQNIQLKNANDFFKDVHIFYSYLKDYELYGVDKLEILSQEIFENQNPYQIFSKKDNFFIEENHGSKILNIEIPDAKIENLNLERQNDDLIITYLNQTRRFVLDEKLKRRELSKYVYENPYLKIYMDY